LRVHQVGGAQVSIEVRSVASNVDVVAVESVKEILEGNNTLNILELSKNTLNLVTSDALELVGGSC
jgi:hypothetical protein